MNPPCITSMHSLPGRGFPHVRPAAPALDNQRCRCGECWSLSIVRIVLVLAAFSGLLLNVTRTLADDKATPVVAALRKQAEEAFGKLDPVPAERLEQPDVKLGQALFWDVRISLDGKTACASCHVASDYGADRRTFSPDAKGKTTTRNAQTVFNAVLQPSLRWTGDRKSGAQQAERSLTGSMGLASADAVVPLLEKLGYAPQFQAAFPDQTDPVSPANYGRAIEAYEATLVTPAPFDRFLAGDDDALSADAQRGLALFLKTGCADCHSGRLVGGESLEKFGQKKDYWLATQSAKRDPGRFEATQQEADRNVFRVSMLRNIAQTGPYFHDGSVATLRDAVQTMADVQFGARLSDVDANAIVAWLESLTGDVPANYRAP